MPTPAANKAPRGESLAIFETLRVQREAHQRKLALMSPGTIVPSVGYMFAVTWFVIFLAFAPFRFVRQQNDGIPVRLLRGDVIGASVVAGPVTGLLVYVDATGELYLNSKRVTAAELQAALANEFARRADWSVYVEGDPDAAYLAVIQAMDLVRGAHGRVILLTPEMRAEAEMARRR